jgi:ribosomal protein S18 acetylase RimI-like enzyme
MPEDTLRWPGGWARLGPWRGEREVAYLAVGAQRPPSAEVLDRCLRTLRGRGYQRVLTNALAPAEALPFVDAGFSVHERLHLLAHDLGDLPAAGHETRRARPDDHPAVLALDARAFRPFWRLDADGLTQALDATPTTRFRLVDEGTELVGYAITGRADRRGYLQRVGVDPAAQGRGFGRTLVVDALRWLRRHRARDAVVNTQLDNDAALALYRSCGFRELPSGLCVMTRSL